MKKRMLNSIKVALSILFAISAIVIGVLMYRVFMGYLPGSDINRLFQSRVGMPAFRFFGISAAILVGIPVLWGALEVYAFFSTSYAIVHSERGRIFLSDRAMVSFIQDTVSLLAGVEDVTADVRIFKENRVGVNIWVDTDEKNDFIRFSDRILQRVLQDLEFNFGINKIRYFNVYVESTNIESGSSAKKVKYK